LGWISAFHAGGPSQNEKLRGPPPGQPMAAALVVSLNQVEAREFERLSTGAAPWVFRRILRETNSRLAIGDIGD
jgi:hypothetical protein